MLLRIRVGQQHTRNGKTLTWQKRQISLPPYANPTLASHPARTKGPLTTPAHALLNKHACDRLSTPMLQTFSTSVFRPQRCNAVPTTRTGASLPLSNKLPGAKATLEGPGTDHQRAGSGHSGAERSRAHLQVGDCRAAAAARRTKAAGA